MKIVILLAVAVLAFASDMAEAVVGRPLTPVSYAGVARRTARRNTGYAYPPGGAVVGAAAVATLPAGCSHGANAYYHCGSTYYQPQYSGTNVVYVNVPPP